MGGVEKEPNGRIIDCKTKCESAHTYDETEDDIEDGQVDIDVDVEEASINRSDEDRVGVRAEDERDCVDRREFIVEQIAD